MRSIKTLAALGCAAMSLLGASAASAADVGGASCEESKERVRDELRPYAGDEPKIPVEEALAIVQAGAGEACGFDLFAGEAEPPDAADLPASQLTLVPNLIAIPDAECPAQATTGGNHLSVAGVLDYDELSAGGASGTAVSGTGAVSAVDMSSTGIGTIRLAGVATLAATGSMDVECKEMIARTCVKIFLWTQCTETRTVVTCRGVGTGYAALGLIMVRTNQQGGTPCSGDTDTGTIAVGDDELLKQLM